MLTTSGKRVRHIVSFQDNAVQPGYWDIDHDRLRTRTTRHSRATVKLGDTLAIFVKP